MSSGIVDSKNRKITRHNVGGRQSPAVFNQIVQLPHITGKGVLIQKIQGIGRYPGKILLNSLNNSTLLQWCPVRFLHFEKKYKTVDLLKNKS